MPVVARSASNSHDQLRESKPNTTSRSKAINSKPINQSCETSPSIELGEKRSSSPDEPVSAAADGADRWDVLPRDLEEVPVHVVLHVAPAVGGDPADAVLRRSSSRARRLHRKEGREEGGAPGSRTTRPESARVPAVGGGVRIFFLPGSRWWSFETEGERADEEDGWQRKFRREGGRRESVSVGVKSVHVLTFLRLFFLSFFNFF